jgi:hypothetical protein
MLKKAEQDTETTSLTLGISVPKSRYRDVLTSVRDLGP